MEPTPPTPDSPVVSKPDRTDPRDQVLTDTVETWRANYPGRWDLLVPMMLIVDAESDWRTLSNGGGDPRLNDAQRNALVEPSRAVRRSQGLPDDWEGNNGVSVGPTQASPSEATRLRTDENGNPAPWGGWGTIAQCMNTRWIIAKTLDRLAAVDASGGVVAWCWRVQQWLATSPDEDRGKFADAEESLNYSRRITRVTTMMDNYSPTYFTDGGP